MFVHMCTCARPMASVRELARRVAQYAGIYCESTARIHMSLVHSLPDLIAGLKATQPEALSSVDAVEEDRRKLRYEGRCLGAGAVGYTGAL